MMKHYNDLGFSIIEIVAALVILVIVSSLIIIQVLSYRNVSEQKIHLMNATNFIGAVQNAHITGLLPVPEHNQSKQVTLADIERVNTSFFLKNPSESNQMYHEDSMVDVSNHNGLNMYSVTLKSHRIIYINNQPISQLKWREVQLE